MNNLTGKELIEKGIITGQINEANIAQHGVDLNLIKVFLVKGDKIGHIPSEGKTILANREEVKLVEGERPYWELEPGTYDITLAQGCEVPADKMLLIRQRSSLLRNGTILHSSVFDAGFKTDNIGTVMIVTIPIIIEFNARVCQIYSHNSNIVQNLYNGQFQNDKQRVSQNS